MKRRSGFSGTKETYGVGLRRQRLSASLRNDIHVLRDALFTKES